MGLLKTILLADVDTVAGKEPETPAEARQNAVQAALDQLIAERTAKTLSSGVPPLAGAGFSTIAASPDRRAGEDRRHQERQLAAVTPERRFGEDRRGTTARANAFGRRTTRSV